MLAIQVFGVSDLVNEGVCAETLAQDVAVPGIQPLQEGPLQAVLEARGYHTNPLVMENVGIKEVVNTTEGLLDF